MKFTILRSGINFFVNQNLSKPWHLFVIKVVECFETNLKIYVVISETNYLLYLYVQTHTTIKLLHGNFLRN